MEAEERYAVLASVKVRNLKANHNRAAQLYKGTLLY